MVFRASFCPPGIYMLRNDFIRSCPLIFFFFFLATRHGMRDLSSLCMCVKLLQLYLILCSPVDQNPPGSFVLGILQARILEWVALPSCRGSSRDRIQVSYISCIGRRVLYHQCYYLGSPEKCAAFCKDSVEQEVVGIPFMKMNLSIFSHGWQTTKRLLPT